MRFRENLIEGWREFWARDWLWSVIVIWMVLMLTHSRRRRR